MFDLRSVFAADVTVLAAFVGSSSTRSANLPRRRDRTLSASVRAVSDKFHDTQDLSNDVGSSIPVSNRNINTPISASALLVGTSRIIETPLGARAMQTARKPRMRDTSKRRVSGMMMTVVNSSSNASLMAAPLPDFHTVHNDMNHNVPDAPTHDAHF